MSQIIDNNNRNENVMQKNKMKGHTWQLPTAEVN